MLWKDALGNVTSTHATQEIYYGFCGDGITGNALIPSGPFAGQEEQCDFGELNGVPCDPEYGGDGCQRCTNTCVLIQEDSPYCGDGMVQQPPEECDL